MKNLITFIAIILAILSVGYIDGKTQQIEASVSLKQHRKDATTTANQTKQPFSYMKGDKDSQKISQYKAGRFFQGMKSANLLKNRTDGKLKDSKSNQWEESQCTGHLSSSFVTSSICGDFENNLSGIQFRDSIYS